MVNKNIKYVDNEFSSLSSKKCKRRLQPHNQYLYMSQKWPFPMTSFGLGDSTVGMIQSNLTQLSGVMVDLFTINYF